MSKRGDDCHWKSLENIEPAISVTLQKSCYFCSARKNWKLKNQSLSRIRLFVTPLDCSPPGSSVHGILQPGTLEWVAIPFSRGSSQPRAWTWVSCIAGRFFTIWATREESPLAKKEKQKKFSEVQQVLTLTLQQKVRWIQAPIPRADT